VHSDGLLGAFSIQRMKTPINNIATRIRHAREQAQMLCNQN